MLVSSGRGARSRRLRHRSSWSRRRSRSRSGSARSASGRTSRRSTCSSSAASRCARRPSCCGRAEAPREAAGSRAGARRRARSRLWWPRRLRRRRERGLPPAQRAAAARRGGARRRPEHHRRRGRPHRRSRSGLDAAAGARRRGARHAARPRRGGARARRVAGRASSRWHGELARRVLRRILAEARATPPTEAELRDATDRRWLEIDRPEGFRTVHAVVRFEPRTTTPKEGRARALAEAIRAAVLPVAEQRGGAAAARGRAVAQPVRASAPKDDPDPLSAAFRKAVAAVPARRAPGDGRAAAPGDGGEGACWSRGSSTSTRTSPARPRRSRRGARSARWWSRASERTSSCCSSAPRRMCSTRRRARRQAPRRHRRRARARRREAAPRRPRRASLDRPGRRRAPRPGRRGPMSPPQPPRSRKDIAPPRDQATSPFTRVLERLVAVTPGAQGAALVDFEGETVDYAGRLDPFELKITAAHWLIVLSETAEAAQLGPHPAAHGAGARARLLRAAPRGELRGGAGAAPARGVRRVGAGDAGGDRRALGRSGLAAAARRARWFWVEVEAEHQGRAVRPRASRCGRASSRSR